MSVLIFRNQKEISYDTEQPIEEQVKGSEKILVNYYDNDPVVERFLDEVERLAKTSFGFGLNIKVIHNNLINGARVKNRLFEATENMTVNDIIHIMASMYHNTDKKLLNMAKICKGEDCDE